MANRRRPVVPAKSGQQAVDPLSSKGPQASNGTDAQKGARDFFGSTRNDDADKSVETSTGKRAEKATDKQADKQAGKVAEEAADKPGTGKPDSSAPSTPAEDAASQAKAAKKERAEARKAEVAEKRKAAADAKAAQKKAKAEEKAKAARESAAEKAKAAAAKPASAAAGSKVAAKRPAGRPASRPVATSARTRTARLRLVHVDPWSVMKTAFLLSIAIGVIMIVAVTIIWGVLGAAGVWDSINSSVRDTVGSDTSKPFNITDYVGYGRVIGFTMVASVIDVIVLTALAALGAFVYNLAATLLGGVEVTLAEDR